MRPNSDIYHCFALWLFILTFLFGARIDCALLQIAHRHRVVHTIFIASCLMHVDCLDMSVLKTYSARGITHVEYFSKPDGIAALVAVFFVTPYQGMTMRRIKGLNAGSAWGILTRIKDVIGFYKIFFFDRAFDNFGLQAVRETRPIAFHFVACLLN